LHYARHAFSGLKSTKKLAPYFECSGAGTEWLVV